MCYRNSVLFSLIMAASQVFQTMANNPKLVKSSKAATS